MTYKYRGTVPAADSNTSASKWVISFEQGTGRIGYADNSDRTSWTTYKRQSGNATAFAGAYGKDGSGNSLFLIGQSSTSADVVFRTEADIETDSFWTSKNLNVSGRLRTACWGNDSSSSTSGVWFVCSSSGNVFISTDGAVNWTKKVSGDLGTGDNNDAIFTIAGNGSGHFAYGQEDRFHISTNDGSTFSSSTPLGAGVDKIVGIAYTNNTWVVTYSKDGEDNLFLKSAASSDITTWSSEVDLGIAKPGNNTDGDNNTGNNSKIAAYDGRCVIMSNRVSAIARIDVNGTSTSGLANPTITNSGAKDLSTDGNTWMLGADGGDIFESTDSGETWSETVTNISPGGTSGEDITVVIAGKHLPI